MTKQLEAHIAELQKVINGPSGGLWAHGPAVSALIAALEQAQQQSKELQTKLDATEAVALALRDDARDAGKRVAELEASETQLICERDNAEEALADMYQAATGERPEWSNFFSFSDAVDAVEQRLGELEASPLAVKLPESLIKAVNFYEQVKRENPPVETGAWKDATEWVLKEAIRAAGGTVEGE
ncbi:hypothetical protein [Cedecea sp. MMO-103]|uniref:hypothetical protein n=1 Tax=Cedecea sp. MMO-103 TaxID=3081238 RepID=UPI0030164D9E